MSKPEDIPQDVWDEALSLWRDDEADAGEVVIARAILSAENRGEERAAAIIEANMLRSDSAGVEVLHPRGNSGNKVGLAYVAAIRKRGA